MGEFFKPWRRKFGVLTLLMACGYTGLWIRFQGKDERIAARFGWHDDSCKMTVGIFVEGTDGWPYWSATNRCFHEIIVDNQIIWRKITGRTPDISMRLPVGIITEDEFTCEPIGMVVCDKSTYPNWPFKIDWEWSFCGLKFGEMHNLSRRGTAANFIFKYWKIPHWAVVAPLTLLSACLLLSKPRKATQEKPVEPINEKVT